MMLKQRSGVTMLETLLFLGILSIMSGTIVAVYISTQEARIRQRYVAEVEQSGTQVLDYMTKNIRRAEKVLSPSSNATGSFLALQMALNAEYPTIFIRSPAQNLTLVQKTLSSSLLSGRLRMKNLVFRNVSDASVILAFDLSATIPTIPPSEYERHFKGVVTLFTDDQSESGGCGTCAAPSCVNGILRWNHCDSDVCTEATQTVAC